MMHAELKIILWSIMIRSRFQINIDNNIEQMIENLI